LADFLPNWNFPGGFSPYIIYNAGGISAVAIAGDIIFFSLAGPVGDYTGPILCFFAVFFYTLFARRFSEAAMGGVEVKGNII
jgi:hypothetical protein